ncbi:MAG: beta strand repeat-containing protein [Janthinobacterium lividum]
MTNYVVSSGQTLTGIEASYTTNPPSRAQMGETVLVQGGGTLNNSGINGDASGSVQSGGVANATTVSGGSLEVAAGGTINNTTLNGFDTFMSLINYNSFALVDGGTANNTTVTAGNFEVAAGGVANGIVVNSAFNTPTQDTVSAALNVLGVATNVAIEQNRAFVGAGGVLTGATVSGSGTLYVFGSASGVIDSAGLEVVGSGGMTTGTVISGGTESVAGGGITTGTTLQSGTSMVSGTANNTTVAGSVQAVLSGGVANATSINQGGNQAVSVGGSSSGATVNGGGGEINAGLVAGLTLNGGGTLTNSGTASQGSGGIGIAVALTSGGSITNSGTISGTGYGVFSDAGAAVAITNSGTIKATNAAGFAIDLNAGGSITNFGTIVGGSAGQAIKGVSHLILEPGQSIQGAVQGAANSTLELAGTGGSLTGLGSSYTGFGTVQLDQGQSWTLAGSSSLGDGATLDLGAGSTLVASGPLTDATSGTIVFQGLSVLTLASSPTDLTITGMAALDQIRLSGITYDTADTITKVGNVVTVSEASGANVALTIAGAASENFSLNSVAGGGSVLTVKPVIASLTAHADAAGILGAGNVITFDLTPNVGLNVDTTKGVPSLGLSDGGTATYDETASSGGTLLVFRTTVTAGQNTTDLKVSGISFGGATIVDGDGFNTPLDLTSVASLAGSDTGIAILTTPPSAPDTTAPNAPANLTLDPGSDSGVPGDGITNVASATITGSAEAGSTVKLYDNGGTVVVGSGNASSTGLFSIAATLAAGANTLTATATDAGGNVSAASATLAVTLDTTLPTATAITTAPSAAGPLGTGASVTFTLSPSVAVSLNLTQGSPTLSLSDGGTATYDAAASTATALVFQDTVLAGQGSSDLLVTGLSLGGATITDAAGNVLDVSTVPPLSGSNTGLVVNTTPATPPAMGVTTMAGAKGGTVFTTVANASNSVTATATGSDVVNSLGSDTVQAGGGSDIVYASGPAATVMGGAGNLTFVAGAGSYVAGGGAGVNILYGGNGPNVLTGGAGKTSIIVAGFGNTSLVGGAGSAGLMFGGFGASTFTGSTGGADTLVGGAGANTFNMTNGDIAFGGPNGPDTYNTGSGSTLLVEGSGVSQINVGSGLTTDFAGTGLDTYTIKSGTNGTANIIGFKASDHIALTGGFTAADAASAVSKATTGSFGTTLNLSDGTKVNLFGVSITASQVAVG